MTHQMQTTALDEIMELLAEHGFDGMAQAVTVLLNEVMKLERTARPRGRPLPAGRAPHRPCQRLQAQDPPHPARGRSPWPSRRPGASSSTPRPWRRASAASGP